MTISTWKLLREKWKLISSTKYFAKLSKVIGLWFIKRKTEFENIWIFAPKPTIDLVWDLVTFEAKIQLETIWLLAPKSTINTTWNSLAPKFKFETFEFWRQNTWKAGWKRSSFWNTYGSISLCKHEFFGGALGIETEKIYRAYQIYAQLFPQWKALVPSTTTIHSLHKNSPTKSTYFWTLFGYRL